MSPSRALSDRARLEAMTAADFEALAELAGAIWRAHFTGIIGSAQVDYMLAQRYTPETLRTYLNADDRWFVLLRIGQPASWILQLCTDGEFWRDEIARHEAGAALPVA